MDLIDRQAVIDALNKRARDTFTLLSEYQYYLGALHDVADDIKQLPSVQPQPEIIRCKDCKHYKAYEYTGKLACHYVIGGTVVRNLNDFCSRAEKENR